MYYGSVKRVPVTTRKATSSLAGLLEELELRRPSVVTGSLLTDVIAASGSHLTKQAAAERLVREGWLLPLRTRDAWEFAPASRAGRYSSGDPWIELRAVLGRQPDAPVAVAFASAVWELGLSSHQPDKPTFAHRDGWRPPRALGDARSVNFDWRLEATNKGGLPVWRPATIVVAAAKRPQYQDNWGNADEWLVETMLATTPDDVLTEATGHNNSTLARLGYLAERSGREDIATAVEHLLPERLLAAYFGSRKPRGRWVNRWALYDSTLPAP